MDCEAVVAAAGFSSRADGYKMGFDLGGKPVLCRTVEALLPVCARVYVVSGYRAEEIEALAAGYADVQVVYNPDFALGMFSSVRAGAARVRAPRFFFTPGDCPLITTAVCRALLDTPGEVVQPVYSGRKGHPVLLAGALAEEIGAEPADSNLRAVLRRHTCATVPVDEPGVLLDLDTQEDLAALRRLEAQRRETKDFEGGTAR